MSVRSTPVKPGAAVEVDGGFTRSTDSVTESATAGGGLGGKNPSSTVFL